MSTSRRVQQYGEISMKVTVDTKYLASLFGTFATKSKTIFNFKFDTIAGVIDAQMLGLYVANTSIPCTVTDSYCESDNISFFVDKSIAMLDIDEPTNITVDQNFIIFEQQCYRSVHAREFEARQDTEFDRTLEFQPFAALRLKSIVMSAVSCGTLVKELAISQPDFIVANKKVYLDYRQAVLVDEIDLPDMIIPFEVLRDIAGKLDEAATYHYDASMSLLSIRSSRYEIWIQTTQRSIDSFSKAIGEIVLNSKQVATVSFEAYKSKLDIFATSFTKQKVWFTFSDSRFNINAEKNTSRCSIGSRENLDYGIELSTGQVVAMSKIFSSGEVDVYLNNKCVLLQKGQRWLIMSGMLWSQR